MISTFSSVAIDRIRVQTSLSPLLFYFFLFFLSKKDFPPSRIDNLDRLKNAQTDCQTKMYSDKIEAPMRPTRHTKEARFDMVLDELDRK